ncbi:hypothetical protein [Aquabacterium sp.]|uniref:hypothetical protein n=1 Tax=Aquabacterium sp. TaxID=1872578 RepID=UPI002E37EEC9|nr:hypothetical protein [Aquabacterium sp.]HEX5311976.1 hypothetical protein [Aquabacterium sp.]
MNLTKHGIAWIVCVAFAGGAWAVGADSATANTQDGATAQSAPASKASKRPKQEVNWYTTPGWKIMTPDERKAYRDKVHATQSLEECQAFVHDNYQQMAERAKAAGKSIGAESNLACKRLAAKKP